MHTGLKVAAFAAALGATFGAAYGVGHTVEPMADPKPAGHSGHGSQASPAHGAAGRQGGDGVNRVGGLQISDAGYTLDLGTPRIQAGERTELRFSVRGPDGRKVTAYEKAHGKELHLILAGRDLSTYQHLHPTRSTDGTWSTPVRLPKAGDYRVFADFTPGTRGARNLTLGADLAVAGTYKPAKPTGPSRTATVDGYTVTLDGFLTPGAAGELTMKVTRGGRDVTDLQPYLEAYGHLVALRSGDLAYVHVHPDGEPGDGTTKPGPEISFTATAPSAGTYRLFLDFKHGGKVHTAAFTLQVADRADAMAEGYQGVEGDAAEHHH